MTSQNDVAVAAIASTRLFPLLTESRVGLIRKYAIIRLL